MIIFLINQLIWSVKGQNMKIEKSFSCLKTKIMSSNCLFCEINSPKYKIDVDFTMTYDYKKSSKSSQMTGTDFLFIYFFT